MVGLAVATLSLLLALPALGIPLYVKWRELTADTSDTDSEAEAVTKRGADPSYPMPDVDDDEETFEQKLAEMRRARARVGAQIYEQVFEGKED